MARHPFQPEPVEGAALYWADHKSVLMRADGHSSVIQTCKSAEAACNAALRWQKKENAAVLKEAKRLKKLGIAKLSDDGSYPPGYMQGRGAA